MLLQHAFALSRWFVNAVIQCLLWSQVARGVLQHLAAVTGGELDGFESEIDLEDLLETYGLTLPDCRECE